MDMLTLLLLTAVVCEWGILRGCGYCGRDERKGGAQKSAPMRLATHDRILCLRFLIPFETCGNSWTYLCHCVVQTSLRSTIIVVVQGCALLYCFAVSLQLT